MRLLLVGLALFGMMRTALADPQNSIPAPLLPTMKCIYNVLKSSAAVSSVDVYAIDGFRFGFEYSFRGTDKQPEASYVELVTPTPGYAFLGDKIPREVPLHVMMDGVDLTSSVRLAEKCHLQGAFDNLFPQPPARAKWHHIDIPEGFQ